MTLYRKAPPTARLGAFSSPLGVALLFALLVCPALGVSALEISGTFGLGNMAFRYDRAEADETFPGNVYQWELDLGVKQAISDDLSFASYFERDMILRSAIYNSLSYRHSFLQVGVGPFFGLFNSSASVLKPGISTSVQLEFPGVAYVLFRSDSTIGGRLVETGDYTQERSDIAAGFYVRNVIMSATLETRRFSQKTASDTETVDALSIYAFETDIFRKNSPYKVLLSFGYHQLSRSFIHSETDEVVRHTLNSIVLGTNIDVYAAPFLTVSVNLESSMYTFGTNELLGISNPGPGGYLFRAYLGATFNTDQLRRKP